MQYSLYLWPNRRRFHVIKEIGVEEHDGDVRFKSSSKNMANSCMRNASSHNYRKSSFIVDLAMVQIPRSTERVFSVGNIVMPTQIIRFSLSYIGQACHSENTRECSSTKTNESKCHNRINANNPNSKLISLSTKGDCHMTTKIASVRMRFSFVSSGVRL